MRIIRILLIVFSVLELTTGVFSILCMGNPVGIPLILAGMLTAGTLGFSDRRLDGD